MKKNLLSLIVLSLFLASFLNAQIVDCDIDPTCEENIPGNGTICPEDLPLAFVGEEYSESITVIPPSSFQGLPVISAMRIDSVIGLPNGITWGKSEEIFVVTNPITRYCAKLYGTPEEEGEYPLSLYITPYLFGSPMAQVVDDTSLNITVLMPTIADINETKDVSIFPNPASDNFTVEAIGLEHVTVTDLLGKELISLRANSDRLNINISKLNKSYYFIRVRTNKGEFVRKLMKY